MKPAMARREAWNPVSMGLASAMGAAAKAARATGGVTTLSTPKYTTNRWAATRESPNFCRTGPSTMAIIR
jgi:hypothetical protein